MPPRASLKKGMDWAREQQGWIALQQAKMPEARPFAPGARIPIGDAEVEIVWPATGAGRTPRLVGDQLLCGGPREGLEVAPGAAHQVRNVGPADAEFVVVSQPPSHGDRTPAPPEA